MLQTEAREGWRDGGYPLLFLPSTSGRDGLGYTRSWTSAAVTDSLPLVPWPTPPMCAHLVASASQYFDFPDFLWSLKLFGLYESFRKWWGLCAPQRCSSATGWHPSLCSVLPGHPCLSLPECRAFYLPLQALSCTCFQASLTACQPPVTSHHTCLTVSQTPFVIGMCHRCIITRLAFFM